MFAKKIRALDPKIPIILVTALGDITNKVEAFNLGADDYITKPFSFVELLARVKAVIRRINSNSNFLKLKDVTLDLNNRNIFTKEGKEIHLTEKEFDLLKYLINNKGTIIGKEILCQTVWKLNFIPETNICEATVKNLRKKIEQLTGENYIKNIYGEGYILIDD